MSTEAMNRIRDNDNPDAKLEAELAARTLFVQWTQELRRDLAESLEGTVLRGARPVRIGLGGTLRPLTSPGTLVGLALRNTSGAAINLDFYDRADADDEGLMIGTYKIQTTVGLSLWWGPGGISLSRGLAVTVVTGTVEEFHGCVYIRGSE